MLKSNVFIAGYSSEWVEAEVFDRRRHRWKRFFFDSRRWDECQVAHFDFHSEVHWREKGHDVVLSLFRSLNTIRENIQQWAERLQSLSRKTSQQLETTSGSSPVSHELDILSRISAEAAGGKVRVQADQTTGFQLWTRSKKPSGKPLSYQGLRSTQLWSRKRLVLKKGLNAVKQKHMQKKRRKVQKVLRCPTANQRSNQNQPRSKKTKELYNQHRIHG